MCNFLSFFLHSRHLYLLGKPKFVILAYVIYNIDIRGLWRIVFTVGNYRICEHYKWHSRISLAIILMCLISQTTTWYRVPEASSLTAIDIIPIYGWILYQYISIWEPTSPNSFADFADTLFHLSLHLFNFTVGQGIRTDRRANGQRWWLEFCFVCLLFFLQIPVVACTYVSVETFGIDWICSSTISASGFPRPGGVSCPIPSINLNVAPGIRSAVSLPFAGGISRSSAPWTTRVGTEIVLIRFLVSLMEQMASNWRLAPSGE